MWPCGDVGVLMLARVPTPSSPVREIDRERHKERETERERGKERNRA